MVKVGGAQMGRGVGRVNRPASRYFLTAAHPTAPLRVLEVMTYAIMLLRLNRSVMQLVAESASVAALRSLKLATGGAAAAAEAERMVVEKVLAAAEAQGKAWIDVVSGASHLTPQRTVAMYRRKVRANRRRLSA